MYQPHPTAMDRSGQDRLALAQEVAAQLAHALPVEYAAVYERTNVQGELQLRAYAGPAAGLLPPEITVTEWQDAANALEALQEPESAQRTTPSTGTPRNLVVPIAGSKNWYGVIAVAVADEQPLQPRDTDFVRSLAHVLAAAHEAQRKWELQEPPLEWPPLTPPRSSRPRRGHD